MKLTKNLKALFMTLAIALVAFAGNAQPMSRKSPHTSVTGTVNGATITITYGSPFVKGRQIFGGLEAYDKPWRAGADEATTFETSKDLTVEGKKLPAGKYTLFYTPGKNEWTVTFNAETGQWGIKRTGEANFDPAKNVVTVKVKATKIPLKESLTYVINPKSFDLQWEYTSVPVSLK